MTASPTIKLAVLCVASWGLFSFVPVFWTFPTAFLSGAGAAAGVAAINSIGTLGSYFGPSIFGQLHDWSGNDAAGLTFLAGCPIIGIIIVLVLGHNPLLERPVETVPADWP